jgi:hypothetical protein
MQEQKSGHVYFPYVVNSGFLAVLVAPRDAIDCSIFMLLTVSLAIMGDL